MTKQHFTRRDFMRTAGAGAAALTLSGFAGIEAQSARKPNIIFIMADDLGYGDLGCYGQEQILTPYLDWMASGGMRFTQCYAGHTVCAPSRSALMTGEHTGHTPIRGNRSEATGDRVPLEPHHVTVAEILQDAGYYTGIIGKWGLGEPDTTGIPNRQGFDEWFGFLNQQRAHNYYPEYLWRNEDKEYLEGNQDGRKEDYSHDLCTTEALDFIRRNHDRPFFLYLPYQIPHAHNALARETGDGMEVPSYEPYSDMPWSNPHKGYAAMVTRMDRDIGRLFALLDELGIDEDTIVFFTSDNGTHQEGGNDPEFFKSSGPLRGIKRDLYDGGIRVPMIARWPGKIPAGAVSDQVWAFWDFMPTAAELAGASAPEGIDGLSMVPALTGKPQRNHDYLYWEFLHGGAFKQAVRMGDWKAVRNDLDEPTELYYLPRDIGEENDRAGEFPDIVAKAEALFVTARTESEHWPKPNGG